MAVIVTLLTGSSFAQKKCYKFDIEEEVLKDGVKHYEAV